MISRRQLFGALVMLPALGLPAVAQQPLSRPIVLYRPTAVSTTTPIQRGSTVATPVTLGNGVPSGPRPATIFSPGAGMQPLPQASAGNQVVPQTSAQNQQNPAQSQPETPEQQAYNEWQREQSRPTNPMLQNPSGAFNMTHQGITNQQQMAPNQYFGQQFQTWTNQQPVAQMPATFGELSRFQPGQFGGYVGPNTYLGSGFSNWSNMSSGGLSPGATGSWSFSVWP